jgi:hypothetical protein
VDGGDLPDREGERVKLWAKTPPESFWVVKGEFVKSSLGI